MSHPTDTAGEYPSPGTGVTAGDVSALAAPSRQAVLAGLLQHRAGVVCTSNTASIPVMGSMGRGSLSELLSSKEKWKK